MLRLLMAATQCLPLQGMEQDHLIELSLRHADEHKIAQIKAAVMSKGKHKGGHRHGHHKVAQKA
jgi:5-methylcytosine-specific restriction endonuclease McrA